jgi:hypothetical protein
MASPSFIDRFRNKLDQVGRDGTVKIESCNAVSKEHIPENKTHHFYKKVLHSSNLSTDLKQRSSWTKSMDTLTNHNSAVNLKTVSRVSENLQVSDRNLNKKSSYSRLKNFSGPLDSERDNSNLGTSCIKLPPLNPNSMNLNKALQFQVRQQTIKNKFK